MDEPREHQCRKTEGDLRLAWVSGPLPQSERLVYLQEPQASALNEVWGRLAVPWVNMFLVQTSSFQEQDRRTRDPLLSAVRSLHMTKFIATWRKWWGKTEEMGTTRCALRRPRSMRLASFRFKAPSSWVAPHALHCATSMLRCFKYSKIKAR